MYNILTSDMMTENPDVAQSNLGNNRKIGYLYKGMTPEQKTEIRKMQLAQIEEAKVNCSYNFALSKKLLFFCLIFTRQRKKWRSASIENGKITITVFNDLSY